VLEEASTSNTMVNIPILKCNVCQYTDTDAEQLRSHYKSIHKISMAEDDIIGLNKSELSCSL